jgi:hypothetical protein
MIQGRDRSGEKGAAFVHVRFCRIPDMPSSLVGCDYVIMQSFWLNEPVDNRPKHMSFQNAIPYIKRLKPKHETYLVHMGDADRVPGDPANHMAKKYEPKDPLNRRKETSIPHSRKPGNMAENRGPNPFGP